MPLNDRQNQEFTARARQLGHDPAPLERGEEICTYFTLPSLEASRELCSMATETERQERQQTFFNPTIAARRRLGQGVHDRGEAAAFAAGTLDESDRYGLSLHLPVHVKAISVQHKTIAAGTVWDVSVRGEVWGLDDHEELYVLVNVGVLTIELGGALIVRGNVLSLLCQEVHHLASKPGETGSGETGQDDTEHHTENGAGFQIGILPTPFSVDHGRGPLHGPDGLPGEAGRAGGAGLTPEVEPTFLGLRLRANHQGVLHALDVMRGQRGGDGAPGQDGTAGRNGGMCKLAELTLRRVEGNLTVYAQAGTGGNGGRGGDGGAGGRGGDGGDGHRLLWGPLPGGDGGDGGDGGPGGRGGKAGNGGIASNIYVCVSPQDEPKITCLALPSLPGKAGAGGVGGRGGAGGKGGKGDDDVPGGEGGKGGKGGNGGSNGLAGRARPVPPLFLNGKLVNPHTGAIPVSET